MKVLLLLFSICVVFEISSAKLFVDPGLGTYDVVLGRYMLPAHEVKKWLPDGLYLDENYVIDATYPVVVGFGIQINVHPIIPVFDWTYLEWIIGVPYVYKNDTNNGPFSYWPHLFLNLTEPVIAGLAYGFNKTLASMSIDKQSEWTTYTVDGILQGSGITYQSSYNVSNFPGNKNFQFYVDMLSHTVVGYNDLLGFVCSTMTMDWYGPETYIQEVSGIKIEWEDPDWLYGISGTWAFGDIVDDPNGAVRMFTTWQLTAPEICV